MATKKTSGKPQASSNGRPPNGRGPRKTAAGQPNEYGIPDWRLEHPDFEVVEVSNGSEVHYEIRGNLNTPVPPIRESSYLKKEQCLELYRWMVMNRLMEQALENLYKQ